MPQRDGGRVADPPRYEEGGQEAEADIRSLLVPSTARTDGGSVAWRRIGVVAGILVALAGGAALLSAGARDKLAVAASGLRDAVSANRILGGEPGRKMCVPVHGKDVYGDELDVLFADDMDARGCEWNCGERQDCGCWSFNPGKDNGCWLKKDPCGGFHDGKGASADVISGECSNCPFCSPQTRPKPWVVIPFYSRDLCKMKMTAASISKHDPHGYLGDVVLIWLDPKTPGAYQHDVDAIIGAIQSTHGVTFHDFSWTFKGGMKGWGIQQVMKLKAALLVHADFYVVLDAKNTFIRDVEHDTFITSCNTGVIYAEYTVEEQGEKKGWFEQSAKALGVPVPSGKVGGSITPVVMHTQTVKDMLRHLSEEETVLKLCSGKLCDYIDDGATEFTLYYTYARQLADEKCIHHTVPHHPALSLWRGIDGSARENTAKTAIDSDDIIMFGSQPGVFDGLQGAQWYNIAVAVETIYGDVAGLHDKEHSSKESLMDCCCGGH